MLVEFKAKTASDTHNISSRIPVSAKGKSCDGNADEEEIGYFCVAGPKVIATVGPTGFLQVAEW